MLRVSADNAAELVEALSHFCTIWVPIPVIRRLKAPRLRPLEMLRAREE